MITCTIIYLVVALILDCVLFGWGRASYPITWAWLALKIVLRIVVGVLWLPILIWILSTGEEDVVRYRES